MKFLFLLLVFSFSTAGRAEDAATFRDQLNKEIADQKTLFSGLKALSQPVLIDFANSTKDTLQLTNVDSEGRNSADQENVNKEKYQRIIEELASNDERSQAEGENKAITQVEANLMVKYFQELNLQPQTLLKLEFTGGLRIASLKDKAQARQTVENIAKTRTDMNNFLFDDVRCFFRGYADPNSALDESRSFSKKEVEAKVAEADLFKQSLQQDVLTRSDDVTIVGKCRGWGLCHMPPITLLDEMGQQFEIKVFNCEDKYKTRYQ